MLTDIFKSKHINLSKPRILLVFGVPSMFGFRGCFRYIWYIRNNIVHVVHIKHFKSKYFILLDLGLCYLILFIGTKKSDETYFKQTFSNVL